MVVERRLVANQTFPYRNVSLNDMQGLAARLNGPRQLIEINSIFGHDAFLKEGAALTPIVKRAVTEQLI